MQLLLIFSPNPVESVYIVDCSGSLFDSNEESKVVEDLLDRYERGGFAVCLGSRRSSTTNDLLVYKIRSE